jgi:hypothetical protein
MASGSRKVAAEPPVLKEIWYEVEKSPVLTGWSEEPPFFGQQFLFLALSQVFINGGCVAEPEQTGVRLVWCLYEPVKFGQGRRADQRDESVRQVSA